MTQLTNFGLTIEEQADRWLSNAYSCIEDMVISQPCANLAEYMALSGLVIPDAFRSIDGDPQKNEIEEGKARIKEKIVYHGSQADVYELRLQLGCAMYANGDGAFADCLHAASLFVSHERKEASPFQLNMLPAQARIMCQVFNARHDVVGDFATVVLESGERLEMTIAEPARVTTFRGPMIKLMHDNKAQDYPLHLVIWSK